MFGYVRPLKDELKLREWDMYRAAYCGLCHALKRRCGFAARFTVNYDFTFLAIVMAAINGEKICICHKRCIASPMRKKSVCEQSRAFDFAADTSVILAYWKLKDHIKDSGFFEGLPSRAAEMFLRSSYRRAAGQYPEFSEYVREYLGELARIENDRVSSIDAPADTFARILRKLADAVEDAKLRRVCAEMFYQLGRYIYIIDAWDDLEHDLKNGVYNPVAERFGIKKMPVSLEICAELKETLAQSIRAILSAFELADFGECEGLLKNILSLGLPGMVGLVERGEVKKKEKKIHERPV